MPPGVASETTSKHLSDVGGAIRRIPPSGAALLCLVALAPFWTLSHVRGTTPVTLGSLGVITVGRVLLVVLAATVAVDLAHARRLDFTPLRIAFVVFLVELEAWVFVNGHVWGCLSCSGSFGGLTDVIAASILALVTLVLHPRLQQPLLLAMVFACVLGGALALAHTGRFVTGVHVIDKGRLTGPYGNANFLAFAMAPGIAILIALTARRGARAKVAAAVASVPIAAALTLSYSRGGLLTAALAATLVLVLLAPRRRRVALALGMAALFAVLGAVAYPALKHARIEGHGPVPKPSAVLRAIDHSGWDGTAQGLIPHQPAALENRAHKRVLRVAPTGSGQGVSYPLGIARPHRRYILRLDLKAPRRTDVSLGLEDNIKANSPVSTTVKAGRAWRTFTLSWAPSARSPHARLYVWEPHAGRSLRLRNVRILTRRPHARDSVQAIDTRLLGSDYPLEQERLTVITGADERYYFTSRWKGAKLAVTTFVHHPLRGLGWEQFPVLSNRKLPFGPLPTHDEYLRFAAETGILGLFLLLALAACAVIGVRRIRVEATRAALAGTLLAGAVSLLFVNGLVAPGAGAWVGIAGASAVALAARREPEP